MASPHALYPYPLDSNKPEIRLLELLLADTTGQLKCRLSGGISIDDAPPFSALSYVWGDPSDTVNIEVNGVQTPVTKNLSIALKHVLSCWQGIFDTRPPSSFRLWIDALCINQADLEERSQQVKLMPRLYSGAEIVLAWLGAEEESTLDLGIYILKQLTKAFYFHGLLTKWDIEVACQMTWLQDVPQLLHELTYETCWGALRYLIDLPYWSRAWIFQENVLASKVWYFHPRGGLDYHELIATCMLLASLSEGLTQRKTPRPEFIPSLVWMFLAPMDQSRWLHVRPVLRIKMAKDYGLGSVPAAHGRPDVWFWGYEQELLLLGGTLRATDPKDHVYALLAMTSLPVDVDYSSRKTVRDVHIEFCQACHDMMGRLDSPDLVFFLQYGGIGVFENKYNLPSWAPNFPEASVVGHHPTMGTKYRCLLSPFQQSMTPASISGATLSIHGVRLQKIKRVGGAPDTKLLDSKSEVHAWVQDYVNRFPVYPSSFPTVWALFLAVMRMPRLDFSFAPKAMLLRSFVDQLSVKVPHASITRAQPGEGAENTLESNSSSSVLLSRENQPEVPIVVPVDEPTIKADTTIETASMVRVTLLEALRSNTKRRLFETTDGYLGMGPQFCAEGDVVCLLDGYDDLVLLRERGTQYEYVGPCIVHGLPGDDLVGRLDNEGDALNIERFELI